MPKHTFILDWDGTMFIGITPKIHAAVLYKTINKVPNSRIFYITNNSSRNVEFYKNILIENNLWNEKCNLITSGKVSAFYLKNNLKLDRVFIVGNKLLKEDFKKEGITHCYSNAQAVVVGYDTTLSFKKIQNGHELILKGLPFFATHDDVVCPTINSTIVDCGSIIEVFKKSTGRKPIVIGKPHKIITDYIRRYVLNGDTSNCIIIGDKAETDGKLAQNLQVGFINVSDFATLVEVSDNLKYYVSYGGKR